MSQGSVSERAFGANAQKAMDTMKQIKSNKIEDLKNFKWGNRERGQKMMDKSKENRTKTYEDIRLNRAQVDKSLLYNNILKKSQLARNSHIVKQFDPAKAKALKEQLALGKTPIASAAPPAPKLPPGALQPSTVLQKSKAPAESLLEQIKAKKSNLGTWV